jgi:phage terminase small subunit
MAKAAQPSGATPELNEKQKAFVREYCIDFNATQAAVRAGYSVATAKQQGSRLLSHADVQEALRVALSARAERTNSKADQVLAELERRAFFDPGEVMTVRSVAVSRKPIGDGDEDDDGSEWSPEEGETMHLTDVRFRDWDQLTPEQRRMFAGVKVDAKGALTVRFRDSDAALLNVAKHHGLLRERVELEPSDELMALLDRGRARARGRKAGEHGKDEGPRAGPARRERPKGARR